MLWLTLIMKGGYKDDSDVMYVKMYMEADAV